MANIPHTTLAERHTDAVTLDDSAIPRVTVGLPVHNGERYLADAIDSLLAQTFGDFELIICDNASTDHTEAIGREYASRDSRVHYCRNTTNIGLYPNFNLVRGMARGEFFKWLAHDDVCSPTYLQRCVEALEAAPDASMAYTRATAIDPGGQPAPEFDWHDAEQYEDAMPETRFRRFVAGFDQSVAAGRQHVGLYVFGLIRMSALTRTRPFGGFMWADEAFLAELLLYGRFIEVTDQLHLMRVFGQNTTEIMLAGDLRSWQSILDPRFRGTAGFYRARYQRYYDYVASVWRAPLASGPKIRLTATCAEIVGRRFLALLRQRVAVRS